MAEAPDDAVDRLYGLPRDAFIGERDALARELRGAKRRDEAAAVKALPKPTVAAWAVNQAVRSQPRSARELWEAGDALAGVQEAILAGKGSGADLRTAGERERAAVEPLVDAARGLLSSSGGDLSEATIERVRETLHAAAIDSEAREEVAAGRATRERTPRGLFGAEAVPSPPRRAKAPADEAAPKGRGKAAKAAEGEAASKGRGRAAKAAEGEAAPKGRGRAAKASGREDAAARKREREAEAAREREEAAARKREREEAAARERARKAAGDRVTRAERALAQAEAQSAAAAERLEKARAKERAAVEALADARADLRAL
jgi:hypothetical protein